MEHTPGPWKIMYATKDFGGSYLAVWPTNTEEGTIGSPICKVSPEHLENDTDHANARLIAAAPEMLEALQDCLTAWENIKERPCYDSGHIACQCTPCKVKAAIAKATQP